MPDLKQVLILSDNHGFYSDELDSHIAACDEIWHAGDIGSLESLAGFQKGKIFRAVYGNIDDNEVRQAFSESLVFETEGLKILMTHIGGYPGKYPGRIKKWIVDEKADIFICGHSHICKVMKDAHLGHWHINPGSYGHHGFHFIRTAIKAKLDAGKLIELNVIELGKRGIIDQKMT